MAALVETQDQNAAAASSRQSAPASPRRGLTALTLLALTTILTVVNCAKPLHMDDEFFLAYAKQFANNPLRPYDFSIYYAYEYFPANHVLAPPVLPYWLAAAITVVGENVVLLKLSLLPFHLLLVGSLYSLLRHWATPLAMPLTWMAVLSPAIFPSTNLMLDVPSLALMLTALALFVRACERNSIRSAVVAAVILGVAVQTKYTAMVGVAVLGIYGLGQRRLTLAAIATTIPIAIFIAWECFVLLSAGESHFLFAFQERSGSLFRRVRNLFLPLSTMTAALAPGVLLIAIGTWKHSARGLTTGIAGLSMGFMVVGLFSFTASMLYAALMVVWWVALGFVVWNSLAMPPGKGYVWPTSKSSRLWSTDSTLRFLLLWLALEVAGALLLSPFCAARRVIGVTVASTVLVGHLTSHSLRPRAVWVSAVVSVFLGTVVALIDIREAVATRQLADVAGRIARRESPHGKAWFSSVWSFSYFASQEGMHALAPGETVIRAGDLLFLPELQLDRPDFRPDQCPLVVLEKVIVDDALPWRVVTSFYSGSTPVRAKIGPRLRLTAYRVTADFVPRSYGVLTGIN